MGEHDELAAALTCSRRRKPHVPIGWGSDWLPVAHFDMPRPKQFDLLLDWVPKESTRILVDRPQSYRRTRSLTECDPEQIGPWSAGSRTERRFSKLQPWKHPPLFQW